MPPARPVLTGQRFGRLTVIDPERFAPPAPSQAAKGIKRGNRMPLCRCDCGTEVQVKQHSLRKGETNSCGCLNSEAKSTRIAVRNMTHGLWNHPLYGTWRQMLQRTENRRHRQYKDYGGRGISVCERWHDVAVFIADIERWLGPRPEGLTLDRIFNDHDYRLDNVRWASRSLQRANRRHK